MDFKELLIRIGELLIAGIPLFLSVLTFLSKQKKEVRADINIVKEENSKNKNGILKEVSDKFTTLAYQNQTSIDKTISRVDTSLEESNNILKEYNDKIDRIAKQNELFININKGYMNVIVELLKLDPNAVFNGSYKNVSSKFGMTNEELEKYPNILESDIEVLKVAMIKLLNNIGEDKFNKLLEDIKYEKE